MQVTNDLAKELKDKYRVFSETKQAIKDLNSSNTDLIKEIAGKYDVRPQEVREAFKFAQKMEDENRDVLTFVVDIFENLRNENQDEV